MSNLLWSNTKRMSNKEIEQMLMVSYLMDKMGRIKHKPLNEKRLIEQAKKKGMKTIDAKKSIDRLMREGQIFRLRKGAIQKI